MKLPYRSLIEAGWKIVKQKLLSFMKFPREYDAINLLEISMSKELNNIQFTLIRNLKEALWKLILVQ